MTTAPVGATPTYWSQTNDGNGQTVLTYAVRGGKAQLVLGTLGMVCLAAGAWGATWLLSGGGITAAGLVLVVLAPGGLALFGAYCLDTVFFARRAYVLGSQTLTAQRTSLRGRSTPTEITRSAATAVVQRYTPPGESASRQSQGTWTTFLAWTRKDGRKDEYAFEGMGSAEEARWLAALLTQWAAVPIQRSFSETLQEADAGELPNLDSTD